MVLLVWLVAWEVVALLELAPALALVAIRQVDPACAQAWTSAPQRPGPGNAAAGTGPG
ncbi:MAG: hypothetical protein NTY67_06410 [Cyanobacteria bacterium]|nr:hypothetical protein [Cyanobacteriota bacterium]